MTGEAEGAGAGTGAGAGGWVDPKKEAKALVAPDADGETVGAAGFEFEFKSMGPDIGVPNEGREAEEGQVGYEDVFEPDPKPLKLASFGTGGTGGGYYIKGIRSNAMSQLKKFRCTSDVSISDRGGADVRFAAEARLGKPRILPRKNDEKPGSGPGQDTSIRMRYD